MWSLTQRSCLGPDRGQIMGRRPQSSIISAVWRSQGLHLRSWAPVWSSATLPLPRPGPPPAGPAPPAAAHPARNFPSYWPFQPATEGEGRAWWQIARGQQTLKLVVWYRAASRAQNRKLDTQFHCHSLFWFLEWWYYSHSKEAEVPRGEITCPR